MDKKFGFLKLSLNIYAEMMLRMSTILINTYMISAYNVKLLGAMSGANQIFTVSVMVFSFLSVGCSVVLAQALGANNKKLAKDSIHAALFFNFLIGFFGFLFVFFFANILLEILNIPNDIIKDSATYLKAIAIAMFLESICLTLSAIIRTYKHAKELMFVSLFMNIVCIFLNACFLYGYFNFPRLEILGIGISNVVGRTICLTGFLFIYLKILKLKLSLKLFLKIKSSVLFKILKIGSFAAGEGLLWDLQYLIIFSFIAKLGSEQLSIQPIYFQISMCIFYATSAISIANEIVVGNLVGQDKYENAYFQTFRALKYSLICTSIFLSFVLFFKEDILNLVHFNENLKTIARPLFMISIWLEFSRAFNIVMVNALRSSGDFKFPFFMGIIFMWGVSVPLAWILINIFNLGIAGAWLAFSADEFLRGICNTSRWISKKWQNKKLV